MHLLRFMILLSAVHHFLRAAVIVYDNAVGRDDIVVGDRGSLILLFDVQTVVPLFSLAVIIVLVALKFYGAHLYLTRVDSTLMQIVGLLEPILDVYAVRQLCLPENLLVLVPDRARSLLIFGRLVIGLESNDTRTWIVRH